MEMEPHHLLALDQAIAWITAHLEPIGIIVSGSIVRGNPNKNSDFDIYVIHENAYRQRVQRRFNEVPCEIFINTFEQVQRYFTSEQLSNRPVTANMLATGQLLHGQQHPQIIALIEEAKKYAVLPAPFTEEQLTFRTYGIATLFEDATDTVVDDPLTSSYILDKVVDQLVELIFVTQRCPLPRLKERLSKLLALDPIAGSMIQQYYDASGVELKYELAKPLVLHVIGKAEFFEWTSIPN